MPKTKWKLRSDRKENKGCPLIILADMDRKDLTASLDLLERLKAICEAEIPEFNMPDLNTFLQTFRK